MVEQKQRMAKTPLSERMGVSAEEETSLQPAGHQSARYVAPDRKDIDAFARQVCQKLEKDLGEGFDAPQMWMELATCLDIVATICAERLSEDPHLFDNIGSEY